MAIMKIALDQKLFHFDYWHIHVTQINMVHRLFKTITRDVI